MIMFMIVCWNQCAGFSLKIESMHFAFLVILMSTIANGLNPRVLMHIVLTLANSLHRLDVLNLFVTPLIVLRQFGLY